MAASAHDRITEQLLDRLDDGEVLDLGTRSAQNLGNATGCSFSARVGDDVTPGDEFDAGFVPSLGIYLFVPSSSDVDVADLLVDVADRD